MQLNQICEPAKWRRSAVWDTADIDENTILAQLGTKMNRLHIEVKGQG